MEKSIISGEKKIDLKKRGGMRAFGGHPDILAPFFEEFEL